MIARPVKPPLITAISGEPFLFVEGDRRIICTSFFSASLPHKNPSIVSLGVKKSMLNNYSDEWYLFFLQPIQPQQTELEIEFLTRNLPQPKYRTLVDLCCGAGRHSNLLGLRSYDVIGIDNNLTALNQAKKNSNKNVTYLNKDMRKFADLHGNFDAVMNLWQSFGYFDESTNQDILRQVAEKLTSNGRFILDIYHRDFFKKNQGEYQFEKEGILVTETKWMKDNRLTVKLTYDSNKTDQFNWQLYTPEEMIERLKGLGLRCVLTCTNFDEEKSPSENSPRIQYVFEKVV